MRMMGRLSSKRYRIYHDVVLSNGTIPVGHGWTDDVWDGTASDLDRINASIVAKTRQSMSPDFWAYNAPLHVQIISMIELWGEAPQ